MLGMLRHIILSTRSIRYGLDRLTYSAFCDQCELEKLRGKFAGKPILVVGNGPSLNQTPLDRFKGVPAIGMNKIDLLFDRFQWRPSLIVCVNNLVVKQHAQTFTKSEIPVYLGWKSRIFMTRKAKNVHYFLNKNTQNFSKDLTKGAGSSATVTYTALQFAYFTGADPVILFGVDHSFNVTGKQANYAKREGPDVNHFDPNYFKAGSYWGIPNLEQSEMAYRYSKAAFEADGRKIYDATIGGKLRIFDRIAVEEALAIAQAI